MKPLHRQFHAMLCAIIFLGTIVRATEVRFVADSGSWSDPAHWSTGNLPGRVDTAILDIDDGILNKVWLSDSEHSHIGKLIGREELTISNATLTIDEELEWDGKRMWVGHEGSLNVPKINVKSGEIRINGDGVTNLKQVEIENGSVLITDGDLSQLSFIKNPNNRPFRLQANGFDQKEFDISALSAVGVNSLNAISLLGGVTVNWNNPTTKIPLAL